MASTSVSPDTSATAYSPRVPSQSDSQAEASSTTAYIRPKPSAVRNSVGLPIASAGISPCGRSRYTP